MRSVIVNHGNEDECRLWKYEWFMPTCFGYFVDYSIVLLHREQRILMCVKRVPLNGIQKKKVKEMCEELKCNVFSEFMSVCSLFIRDMSWLFKELALFKSCGWNYLIVFWNENDSFERSFLNGFRCYFTANVEKALSNF